jgi:hypothetical protein
MPRMHHLWLPQDALHPFSAIAAMDLVICKRIVLANRHTLLQKIGGYNSIYDVEEDVYDEVVMDVDHGKDGLSFGNNNIVNYRAITV